jgi:antitoxin component YwqK of YwqJK toxin-antitoxin module
MKPAENIEKLIKNLDLDIDTNAETDRVILRELIEAHEKSKKMKSAFIEPTIRRKIMNNRITKFAVAAVVLAAVVLSITIFDNTAQEAYAIEQSIKASHTVETLHIRQYRSSEAVANGQYDEAYVKYDPSGKFESARMDTAQSSDGPKTIVWSNNVAKVWMHSKKSVLVIRDPKMAREMEEMAVQLDPKRTLQNLYEMQQKGEQDVKITEPEEEGDLITIEVVHDKGREVFYVDPESKLLVRFEKQVLNGQDYVVTSAMEISGYNEPIDENVFTLGNLPKDVFVLDQVNQEIGLAQGNLSDDEIVVEVATQFFQALIDEDYAKAGLLMEGLPPERIKTMFPVWKFVRIVSIGKVVPHSIPLTRGLSVPCEIEMEHAETGERMTGTFNPGIRKVHGRPDRWTIFSGI